jgi:hypothetical protein
MIDGFEQIAWNRLTPVGLFFGVRPGRESRMSKPTRGVSEVEDMLTIRVRQRHSGIARIGIEQGPTGWKAYRVWLLKADKLPSREKTDEVLAEANYILGDLQKHFDIINRRSSANRGDG